MHEPDEVEKGADQSPLERVEREESEVETREQQVEDSLKVHYFTTRYQRIAYVERHTKPSDTLWYNSRFPQRTLKHEDRRNLASETTSPHLVS